MNTSVANGILHKVKSKEPGTILFPNDFKEFGGDDAIKTALSRFNKEGLIRRLAKGIYVKPKYDPELGILTPSIDEIAKAIARRDRARIIPTGTMAMYLLGLTTQVPMNVVYLTDGTPRRINIGERGVITFRSTNPKLLSLEGDISKLIILAMSELGESKITNEILQKIKKNLVNEDMVKLENDRRKSPTWISTILKKLMTERNYQNHGIYKTE